LHKLNHFIQTSFQGSMKVRIVNIFNYCEIWGSHSSDYVRLLSSGMWSHVIWYNLQFQSLLPPFAGCKSKLCGLSPQANYTDRATTACRRS
jgi:hypothetical protein